MICVLHRHCHRCLNSLSQPLQFSHCVAIVKIVAVVRLGFLLCQFSIGKYEDGYIRGCVMCHYLFFFSPA